VVVPGRPLDYVNEHPGRPVLIVEVAETSLAIDRLRKGRLYARADITDYWVVNVDSIRLLRRPATVTALAAPRARIRVAALLPSG
jgi:Uma2 family endonuclease